MPKKEIINKTEREYIIPLRRRYQLAPRYKKTPKAVKSVKEFVAKHMQVRDRDLNKIKIDKFLNEILWFRGIKNPPHKIRVRVVKENDLVRVYPLDLPKKLEFKKKRFDQRTKDAKEAIEKKKTLMQKAKESMKGTPKEEGKEEIKEEDKNQDGIEDKKEEKEKVKSVEELDKKLEKKKSKELKTSQKGAAQAKQPKRPVRNVLDK